MGKKKSSGGKQASHKKNAVVKRNPGKLKTTAPAAVASKIPKSYLQAYSVPDGIGFRGCESLGHLISNAQNASSGGGAINLVRDLFVNPLNPILFPRTNMIARVFEQYCFKRLKLMYVPRSGSSDSTSVLMYYEYDPAESAATTDLDVLAHMTRETSVVWQPCSIDVNMKEVHRNRQSFFVQSLDSGNSEVSPSQLRQDYCGAFRVYTSHAIGGAVSSVNHGYLFIEYDLQLLVPRPPVPVSLTAQPKPMGGDGGGVITIPSNTNQRLALPYKQQQVGMIGGPNEGTNATLTGFFNDAWGSVQGVYDAAKQIYSAGSWIMSMFGNAAAAAFDDEDTKSTFTVVERDCRKFSEFKEGDMVMDAVVCQYVNTADPPTSWYHDAFSRTRTAYRQVGAAGGLAIGLNVYDLNGNGVPGDWPLTADPAANGLITVPIGSSKTYTSTGALSFDLDWSINVPQGKQYVVRWNIVTDAAAGSSRAISGVQTTVTQRPDSQTLF